MSNGITSLAHVWQTCIEAARLRLRQASARTTQASAPVLWTLGATYARVAAPLRERRRKCAVIPQPTSADTSMSPFVTVKTQFFTSTL